MTNQTLDKDRRAATLFEGVCSLLAQTTSNVSRSLRHVLELSEGWLVDSKKALYGLAVARILLGAMIIGFALSNFSTIRYTFGPGAAWTGQLLYPTSSFATIFPFNIVNAAAHTDWGITLVTCGLIVCAFFFMIGYRTRIIMIPLFVLWVGFMSINTYVQDQSDNLTRMSFIYLFFTALSDRWSLDARRREKFANHNGAKAKQLWRFQQVLPAPFTNLLHNLAVAILICQLCFVYASGGLFKAGGAPWQNGTAVYDPIQTERFGTWPVLSDLATAWGPGVAIATIGTVLVQATFPFLMLNRFTRIFAIIVILFFHIGIGILMGLPWFSLSMVALDAIFIRDRSWKKVAMLVRTAFKRELQNHHAVNEETLMEQSSYSTPAPAPAPEPVPELVR
ncbi:HTTM domain-containing protein [Leucobacter denitrificans]|uniref:HTTM domain-containing protein n=1 Tax=Leucobacter denitrificans TaxID=683042 RepID=A0A7G9S5Z4_9MICO|nr:HTTM domain-containing protein [Leucobacter denitrificans]QNN63269.1 HTTM domain-containing protein [Leucobacter denitrificans]